MQFKYDFILYYKIYFRIISSYGLKILSTKSDWGLFLGCHYSNFNGRALALTENIPITVGGYDVSAFHVPNILAFQMNEPCFHSISLGARYEPDRANLSSLRFPKFPPKKVLFGVCHRLCGYCLSTVYYTARTFACSSDLDSGHSHHRYVIASRHIQRTISYIFYDLGFVLPTLPGFIQR